MAGNNNDGKYLSVKKRTEKRPSGEKCLRKRPAVKKTEGEKTGRDSIGHRYNTSSDLLSVTVTKDFTLVLFGAVYLQLKLKADFSVQGGSMFTNKEEPAMLNFFSLTPCV